MRSTRFEPSLCIKPRLKPYFMDGYGSRSIGEEDWRPHPRNALSQNDTLEHSEMGGSGLDWFSRTRRPPTLPPREKRQSVQEGNCTNVKRESEPVSPETALSRQDSPTTDLVTHHKSEENDKYYYMKPLELTLRRAVGAKKKVYCKRNCIPVASLGDKTYQVPEYSRDFHKQGSTRPVISFGGITRCIPDTFIPLQDLPLKPRPTFEERRKKIEKDHEMQSVVALETWKPAPSLVASFQLPLIASHLLH